jgi:hypothetical protein
MTPILISKLKHFILIVCVLIGSIGLYSSFSLDFSAGIPLCIYTYLILFVCLCLSLINISQNRNQVLLLVSYLLTVFFIWLFLFKSALVSALSIIAGGDITVDSRIMIASLSSIESGIKWISLDHEERSNLVLNLVASDVAHSRFLGDSLYLLEFINSFFQTDLVLVII